MIIHAGDAVDAIYYKSTVNEAGKRLGGSGGNPHNQNVGNGIFVGLRGRVGPNINSLGGIFVDPGT